MHRSRVLLSRAAKTIVAAESSSKTTVAKDASSKATLPAATNTITNNNNNSVVAASEPPQPRNGNPNSTLTDNSPFPNNTNTTTTATTTTTETSTSHENSTTKTKIPPYNNIIALYHHAQPNFFPPLRPGTLSYLVHHFSSTMSAIYDLCTSQESRDRFISLTNPSTTTTINHDHDDETKASVAGTGEQRANNKNPIIINTSVLGQSDVGIFKSLTLFQELSHPLFHLDEIHSNHDDNDGNKDMNHNCKKINIKEFMMGCGWALEQFHRTNHEVLVKWIMLHMTEKKANNPKVEKHNEGVVNDTSSSSSSSSSSWPSLFYQNFVSVPSRHSTWLEFDFIQMATPELIKMTEHIIRLTLLPANPTTGTLVDTRVTNVALLSARVKEIYPPSSSSSLKKKPNENSDSVDVPLEDDSLMSHQPASERKVQVVAQLEVLYELQGSINFVVVKDRTESNKQSTSTKLTKPLLFVGKFEACIEGDPNNHQQGDGTDKDNDIGNLRWKLASYRPALEFEKTF